MEKRRFWMSKADPWVAVPALVILVSIIAWALIDAEGMAEAVNVIFGALTGAFGWFYLMAGLAFLGFCIWLVAGPYRNVKLGKDDDQPKYSFFSWFAMIVACGYGVGLVFWGAAEPLTFLQTPPGNIEPMSAEAAVRALAQAFFHWGWTPWAIYMICGVTMGYFIFRKGIPPFFSRALQPIFGNKVKSKYFRILDGFMVYGVIGGVTTATGLGILQLASGLNRIFGIPENNLTYIVIAVAWAVLFTCSAVSGIDKGIKICSDINIPLGMILCGAVFLLGPTSFILNMTSSGLGEMMKEFFTMSLWTDPVAQSGFPQSWTIFYWAWWIASAPSTGLFVAAISRGRTIKEVVVVHLCAAPVATWLLFGTFGGTAIYQELVQKLGLAALMNEKGTQSVVFDMLSGLPLGKILSILFVLLIFLFLSTTVDSFSYVCAQMSTREEENPDDPSKPLRALWAVAIAVLAITLILVGRTQINSLQLSSVAASVAIMLVMILLCVSMAKDLRKNEKKETVDHIQVIPIEEKSTDGTKGEIDG